MDESAKPTPLEGNSQREDQYKRLKRRYSALLQQHLKTHSDYRQTMEAVHELRAKKQYLQQKLAQIIKRIGCDAEQFGLDLRTEAEE